MLETPVGLEFDIQEIMVDRHRRYKSVNQATKELLTMCRQPLLRHLAAAVLMAEEAENEGTGDQILEGLLAGAPQDKPDGAHPSLVMTILSNLSPLIYILPSCFT